LVAPVFGNPVQLSIYEAHQTLTFHAKGRAPPD